MALILKSKEGQNSGIFKWSGCYNLVPGGIVRHLCSLYGLISTVIEKKLTTWQLCDGMVVYAFCRIDTHHATIFEIVVHIIYSSVKGK